jgi:hypothetical protein
MLELQGITNEKDRGIVPHHVVDALARVKLQREAPRIAPGIGTALLPSDRREANQGLRLGARLEDRSRPGRPRQSWSVSMIYRSYTPPRMMSRSVKRPVAFDDAGPYAYHSIESIRRRPLATTLRIATTRAQRCSQEWRRSAKRSATPRRLNIRPA